MITLECISGERMRPVLRCDECGEVIKNEDAGNVVWSVDDAFAAKIGDDVAYRLVHKGTCDRQFEARVGGPQHYSWMPIGFFIARLCRNANIDVAAEQKMMAMGLGEVL